MNNYTSIKGSSIFVDPDSQNMSIEDILLRRFDGNRDILTQDIHDLHDPYLLKDMDILVERIKRAKKNDEKIMIFGDYDVDGVSSTSIMVHMFLKLGMKVSYRLPHRVDDGYGLKTKFVDEALELGVDLMITVDCGSRDREIVSDAKTKGLDVIVTDHHSVPDDMPEDAIAFINPQRPDCDYPFIGLAGAGVAFKIITALAREFLAKQEAEKYIQETIDLAATGTVADCMMLQGENRIIVQEGLKQIKRSRSQGLLSFIEDRVSEDLDADIFGFQIGPRLNAAGRMDTPYIAVNALLNNGPTLPESLARLESLNELRKTATRDFVDQALAELNPSNNILIYHSDNISHGIIGIVAGRITEKYNRPSIVFMDEGEKLVGSCRAPEYFSMIAILEKYKEYFITFGGHKQAAGLSILKEKFPEFVEKITTELNSQDFSQYKKEITADKLLSLDEIGFRLTESIQKFKPYGMGNRSPIFFIKDFEPQKVQFLGAGREHLRLNHRYGFKIFAFGMGEYYDEIRGAKKMNILCEIAEDHWQGKRGIMIRVIDIVL